MTDPTGADARDHTWHADLFISVCHRRPDGDTPGQITPRISWAGDVTPVQRIQLIRSAQALLSQEQDRAMAQVTG
jgi:hypothetical protein